MQFLCIPQNKGKRLNTSTQENTDIIKNLNPLPFPPKHAFFLPLPPYPKRHLSL